MMAKRDDEGDGDTLVIVGSERANAMNVENDEQLEWRDTYFVLFQASRSADADASRGGDHRVIEAAKLENLEADEDGMFESVLVQAPQDNAASKSAMSAAKPSSSRASSWRSR